MASMNVRSGDTVQIIVGGIENRGKQGKVIVANPEQGTVIVEGLNLVTKHQKPRSAQEQGGKVQRPRAIDVSNVMLVCPKCGKATRVAHVLDESGKKYLRSCKKCGAVIDTEAERKATKKATTTTKKTTRKKTATK